jgi:hypothetical protein
MMVEAASDVSNAGQAEDEDWHGGSHLETMIDREPPKSRQEAQQRSKLRPAEELYDPNRLPHWSITMTTAWIIWGDVGAVREEWDDYRHQCAEWRFFPEVVAEQNILEIAIRDATLSEPAPNDPEIQVLGKMGGQWRFAAWSPSGWLGLEFKARRDEMPWDHMVGGLWLAAGEGKIRATAIEYREGQQSQVVEIPPHMWGRLRRTREISGKAMLSAPDRDYRDVRFSRSDVKALWPLKPAKEDARDVMLLGSEARPAKPRTNNRRGRPKEYNWNDIRLR